ncbi:hypothetical protein FRB90_005028 [Tulasnella sp. 427]|nr:hypothetical protein FRB90_005028 [Tulasnella sp. 427]
MINRLDDFRLAIDQGIRRKTIAWRRHRNSLAPISKLPFKIMVIIFDFILFGSSGRRRRHFVHRLTTLRSVSWTWRDLIDRTPGFWTQLSSKDRPDFVSEALQKSRQRPLQLRYVGESRDEIPNAEFWRMAFDHFNRWERVVLQEPHGDLIQTYFTKPPPQLKGFLLSTQRDFVSFGTSVPAFSFGAEWAGLEELRIMGWRGVKLHDVPCQRLRVLEIQEYYGMEMGALLGVIAMNSNCLTTLRLRLIRTRFRPDTHSRQSEERILLPKLKNLLLHVIFEGFNDDGGVDEQAEEACGLPTLQILRRIHIPACTSFQLNGALTNYPTRAQRELIHLFPRPSLIFSRNLHGRLGGSCSKPSVVRIDFNIDTFNLKAYWDVNSERTGYVLSLSHLSYELILEWVRKELVEEWPEGMIKPELLLQYIIDDCMGSMDKVFKLEHVESVVGLQLVGDYTAGRPVLAGGLAERLGSARFPGLKTLKLVNCGVTGGEILGMVEMRSAKHPDDYPNEQTRSDKANLEGLTVILGDGIEKFSKRILHRINATPGVKAIRQTNELSDWGKQDDVQSSRASDESDWKPCYSEDESEDEGSDEDDSDENEFGGNTNDVEDQDNVNNE